MKFLIFAILCHVALAVDDNISNRPCPNRPIMQNFDITKIAGTWYNVMQYKDEYAASFLCGHGNYTVIDATSLKVHECELRDGSYFCLTGIIALMEPNRNPLQGRTSYAYIDDPNNPIDEFKYLSVDYDDHAVVYNCRNIEGGKSAHYLWIASRTPQLSSSGKDAVEALVDKYFDRNVIKLVEQSPNVCDPRI